MSIERTRAMRKNPTEAERRVWRALQLLRQRGLHFRRQVPIGPYYADFACHRAKIVIEVDGSHHATVAQRKRDAQRTRFLEANGYRVLRYWNPEADPNAIAQDILLLAGPSPPAPPHVGGGEQ